MKILFKLALILIVPATVLITTSSISVAKVAFLPNGNGSGAGGSAGSISAEFSAGNTLTGIAGTVAVGKTGAATSANTTATDISAVATGYSGGITISGMNSSNLSYTVGADPNLETAQANSFNGSSKSSLNLVPATVGVTLQ